LHDGSGGEVGTPDATPTAITAATIKIAIISTPVSPHDGDFFRITSNAESGFPLIGKHDQLRGKWRRGAACQDPPINMVIIMAHYRCFFVDPSRGFVALDEFYSASDITAVENAETLAGKR
jgi:hypothetical protein